MIDPFKINLAWTKEDSAQRDLAEISIRARGQLLTQLIDGTDGGTVRDYFRASPISLALWWAENWWRLRYEAYPPGLTPPIRWRMSHELTSAAGGTRWPPLMIYGGSKRLVIAPRAGVSGVAGPLRYLPSPVVSIDVDAYEAGVDHFFAMICEHGVDGDDGLVLKQLLKELDIERNDSDIVSWRRLEAMVGFDPDEAPEQLMLRLSEYQDRLGMSAVEESLAAAPGTTSANILSQTLDATDVTEVTIDVAWAMNVAGASAWLTSENSPWQQAENAARRLRVMLGMPHGPIRAKAFSDILSNKWETLKEAAATAKALPYGAIASSTTAQYRCALKSERGASRQRRFELARALGDVIWQPGTSFGPISYAKTDRQKFQRAFAQSLLCPFDDLMAMIDTLSPSDDDVRRAALHFQVSDAVIRTVLVNKRVLPRETLEDRLEAA